MDSPVKRWDVYDIADELADLPGLISGCRSSDEIEEVYFKIRDLEARLWEASKVGDTPS